MRSRLLLSTLAVAVTAVLLFGLPLAFVMSRLQVNIARDQVERDALTVARTLQNRVRTGQPADLAAIADAAAKSLPDRYVSIVRDAEKPQTFGDLPSRGNAIIAHANTTDFKVTVEADKSVENAGVSKALLLIGSLALLAVALAVGLAMIAAKRLTSPLRELATAADRLGSGDARPLGRRYGIAELDQVAEGLDGS